MPNLIPKPDGKNPSAVQFYHCACGAMWFNLPENRICLCCKQQGKFKTVTFDSPNVVEAYLTT